MKQIILLLTFPSLTLKILNKEFQEHYEKLKPHERNKAKAARPLILSSLSLDNPIEAIPAISFTKFCYIWVETDNQPEYETKRAHSSDLNRFKELKKRCISLSSFLSCSY